MKLEVERFMHDAEPRAQIRRAESFSQQKPAFLSLFSLSPPLPFLSLFLNKHVSRINDMKVLDGYSRPRQPLRDRREVKAGRAQKMHARMQRLLLAVLRGSSRLYRRKHSDCAYRPIVSQYLLPMSRRYAGSVAPCDGLFITFARKSRYFRCAMANELVSANQITFSTRRRGVSTVLNGDYYVTHGQPALDASALFAVYLYLRAARYFLANLIPRSDHR